MAVIKVRLQHSLAVVPPLAEAWRVRERVLAGDPELSVLTYCLKICYGDAVTADELGVFEEMILHHFITGL